MCFAASAVEFRSVSWEICQRASLLSENVKAVARHVTNRSHDRRQLILEAKEKYRHSKFSYLLRFHRFWRNQSWAFCICSVDSSRGFIETFAFLILFSRDR